MSSTVGIGLTPIYILGRSPETVKFHWRTNYGHFISWEPPDYKVYLLGVEVINNGKKSIGHIVLLKWMKINLLFKFL